MRFIDIKGMRFGRITVIERAANDGHRITWMCRCDCGRKKIISSIYLRSGVTSSCGCLRAERILEAVKTHGLSWKIPEYNVWILMRQRCRNKLNTSYKNYGGRGIKVCKRWDSFKNFIDDMGRRPTSKHSLDRVDNDGDYCPKNCRWATDKDQSINKRNNVWITFNGKTLTASQWNSKFKLPRGTITGRLWLGWPIGKAMTPKLLKIFK